MELFSRTNIDFMKYRKFWIVISLALLVVGFVAIFVHGKLNVGIDFVGGTQLTLGFREEPDPEEIRRVIASAGVDEALIQRFGERGENQIIIKMPVVEGSEEGSREPVLDGLSARYNQGAAGLDLNGVGVNSLVPLILGGDPEVRSAADVQRREDAAAIAESILEARRQSGLFVSWDQVQAVAGVDADLLSRLQGGAYLGDFSVLGVENVGPQIGEELRYKGILAVVLSLLGMLIYIWIRFELRFGVGALMATLHDVFVCLGIYALADFEFNLTTIAAFLTLIGYSVNDTVVIFDRVRENMNKNRRKPLIEVLNESVNQTLSRTILTSGTTLLAVGSLLIFGGDVLRGFAFVLTIGIVVGTYSSVYIASPFALLWENLFGSEAKQRRADQAAKAA